MDLSNKTVAILATDGFEEVELTSPKRALEAAGATCHVIAPLGSKQTIRSWNVSNWGRSFNVDKSLTEAKSHNYDALVLPGGVLNPDKLRQDAQAIIFIREFFEGKKPVAAICHAPQLLIEAEVLGGRTVTSYPSIKIDMMNAGANWIDEEVVVDKGLVTSRSPKDLNAFNAKIVEEIGEGVHEEQSQSL